MSTRSGTLRGARPVGLQVALVAVVAGLLVIGIAVAIWLPRTIDSTGYGPVLGTRDANATNQTPQEFAVPDYSIRSHGPNQMPRQIALRDYRIRPHGSNQMPKR